MRDPAYIIILGIALLMVIDHFLFGGSILNYFGKVLTTLAGWIADLFP